MLQGRNEVRWLSGQETSLAPQRSNLTSFGSKCTVEESTCDNVGNFWRPCSGSAPGELLPPCSLSYAPGMLRAIERAFRKKVNIFVTINHWYWKACWDCLHLIIAYHAFVPQLGLPKRCPLFEIKKHILTRKNWHCN